MTATPSVAPREWTRTHPVTPFIHVIRTVFALMAVYAIEVTQRPEEGGTLPGFVLFAIACGAIAIAIGWAAAEWRVNLYRIGDDAVYHKHGIVFHQHRQARLDRLQAVDIIQPFIARVFGFADVKIDVAGGRESNVSIKYLKLEDADALRNEVLALAAGYRSEHPGAAGGVGGAVAVPVPVGATPSPTANAASPVAVPPRVPVVAASERVLYRVPGGRLVGSILVSWSAIALLIVAAVTWMIVGAIGDEATSSQDFGSTGGGVTAMIVWVISLGTVLWAQLNNNANFSAGIAADGIRLSHGLLDTRRQTVPPGRVQALVVKQSLLWRGFDWWKVSLNVAGYHEQKQETVSTLLPVGTRQDALDAVWLVLPDLGDPDPAGTIATAMVGSRAENGFTASPTRSWIFDPLQWWRRGVKATDRALLIRKGWLLREFYVIPHERTQSLAIRQGPLQRLLGLATIEVHSTRGVIRPVAAHLALEDAIALIEDQARRAREGRARQTPEQWMAAVTG